MPSGSTNHSEKRRFPRRKLSIKVGVLSAGAFRFEQAVEIGEGGMLVSHAGDLKKGSRIELCIFVTPNDFFVVSGEIVYVLKSKNDESYAGLSFTNSPNLFREKVKELVEKSHK